MFESADDQDIEVNMSRGIYRKLLRDAAELQVPVEWLVASLVADTLDEEPKERPETVAA